MPNYRYEALVRRYQKNKTCNLMKTDVRIVHTQTPFLNVATKCDLEGDCVTVGVR
jgi:hypothetical protein